MVPSCHPTARHCPAHPCTTPLRRYAAMPMASSAGELPSVLWNVVDMSMTPLLESTTFCVESAKHLEELVLSGSVTELSQPQTALQSEATTTSHRLNPSLDTSIADVGRASWSPSFHHPRFCPQAHYYPVYTQCPCGRNLAPGEQSIRNRFPGPAQKHTHTHTHTHTPARVHKQQPTRLCVLVDLDLSLSLSLSLFFLFLFLLFFFFFSFFFFSLLFFYFAFVFFFLYPAKDLSLSPSLLHA